MKKYKNYNKASDHKGIMTEPDAHLFSVFQTNKKKIWAVRLSWTVDRIQRVWRCRNEGVCLIKEKPSTLIGSDNKVEKLNKERRSGREGKIPHSETMKEEDKDEE